VVDYDGTQCFKWDSTAPLKTFHYSNDIHMRWCAFHKDCVHSFEPVTSGVRALLHFNIIIEGYEFEESKFFENNCRIYRTLFPSQDDDSNLKSCPIAVNKILELLHQEVTPSKSLALPLFDLYRQECILPKHLKGPDHMLYNALFELFDIELVHVIITNTSGSEGDWMKYEVSPTVELRRGTEVTYVVTCYARLLLLEELKYDESGRNPQEGMKRYFTGVMVVSVKAPHEGV